MIIPHNIKMNNNEKYDPTYKIIGAIYEVSNNLGKGLLESAYHRALIHELKSMGFKVQSEVPIEVNYKGESLGVCFRADIIVDDTVILELKAVEKMEKVYFKQLLTYLRLTGKKVGLLINFGELDIKNGIHRIVNNF